MCLPLKRRVYLPVILLISVFMLSAVNYSNDDRYFAIAKNLDIFATLYKEVNALYVDEVNPNEIIRTGIDAMLASLDPYTNYIPEDDIEEFRTQSTGQYGGIGAVTGMIDDRLVIVMVMEGYAAEKNGLKIGDEITHINNIDIRGMNREEANQLMKGENGKNIMLKVKRFGQDDLISLSFKREKVKISNVPYYGMVSENIGLVKLTEFTMQAGREVSNAVEALKAKGATGIILDLRGNPGGLLMEAVNISNVFLPKDKEVVSTMGKVESNNQTYSTLNSPIDTEIPVAVLINSGSASASEIVAGTLQDYDRGVIIGQKSFGKGLVQLSRPLSYNAQLKVTTAKYYTPSGRCIQALDYAHRNADGSVGKIPDSLKSEFKTINNRVVYDGGGIDPDIVVEQEDISSVAYTLETRGLIFEYATEYFYSNPSITEPEEFTVSDQEYDAFKKWLRNRDYSYVTRVEQDLQEMKDHAESQKYYPLIKDQLVDLQKVITESKEKDLDLFSDQIKSLLEREIVERYYLESGGIESSFDNDPNIETAIAVLNDKNQLDKILGRQ